MTIVFVPRVTFTEQGGSAIFHKTLSVTADSDAYKLPVLEMYAIGAYINGDGEIEFTIDPDSAIEGDTAVWSAWDTFSLINLAVTAFRVIVNSGTVVAKVTARTVGA